MALAAIGFDAEKIIAAGPIPPYLDLPDAIKTASN
jgi:hypothetical protein